MIVGATLSILQEMAHEISNYLNNGSVCTYDTLPFHPELKQKLRSLKAYQCDDLDRPLIDVDANAPPSSLHW